MIELDVPGAFIDSPEWSPDGSRLAYTSTDDDGMPHIWVASADGGSAKQITDAKGSDDYPTFSPDAVSYLDLVVASRPGGIHGRASPCCRTVPGGMGTSGRAPSVAV